MGILVAGLQILGYKYLINTMLSKFTFRSPVPLGLTSTCPKLKSDAGLVISFHNIIIIIIILIKMLKKLNLSRRGDWKPKAPECRPSACKVTFSQASTLHTLHIYSKLRRTNDVAPDFSIPDEPKDVSLITGSLKEWVIGAINESMHCNYCMIG